MTKANEQPAGTAFAHCAAWQDAPTVKFKALLPGQRFTTAGGVQLIKLNRTLAGETDAAGTVVRTQNMLANERVAQAAPMVAHATATSKAAVTLVQRVERTAMVKRWSEAHANPVQDIERVMRSSKGQA